MLLELFFLHLPLGAHRIELLGDGLLGLYGNHVLYLALNILQFCLRGLEVGLRLLLGALGCGQHGHDRRFLVLRVLHLFLKGLQLVLRVLLSLLELLRQLAVVVRELLKPF